MDNSINTVFFDYTNEYVIKGLLTLYRPCLGCIKLENNDEIKQACLVIVSKCEEWFENLYLDEVNLLKLRYIDHLQYIDIAVIFGYKGHSGPKHKEKRVISKIIEYETKQKKMK